jgi:hypothetical protein
MLCLHKIAVGANYQPRVGRRRRQLFRTETEAEILPAILVNGHIRGFVGVTRATEGMPTLKKTGNQEIEKVVAPELHEI